MAGILYVAAGIALILFIVYSIRFIITPPRRPSFVNALISVIAAPLLLAAGILTSALSQEPSTRPVPAVTVRPAAQVEQSAVAEESPAEPSTAPSLWRIATGASALDDSPQVTLRVRSTDALGCGFGRRERAELILRCLENTTSLVISTNCHLTSIQSYGRVDMRLDSDPARTVSMRESTNHQSLGLWSGGEAIPFIRSMFGKDTLIARFTPFGANPETAYFPISGIESEIQTLREACHW